MNKESFSYLTANPSDISLKDLVALESLTEEFSYCQLAYTLVAKAYHTQYAEELANEKIRQAAAHALSRNALRKLIHNQFDNHVTLTHRPKFESEYLTKLFNQEVKDVSEDSLKTPIPDQHPLEFMDDSSKILKDTISDITHSETNTYTTNTPNQWDIINTFIDKDPGLIRSTKQKIMEAGKQEDLSGSSVRLSKGIVTENFAKILATQGRYEKAIEVYEQLILKFPEKKAYFAEKIEELA
jgi:tetratricopeptide (TPR) repeat protein